MNKIISSSCEDMKEVTDNSISLTVTSPPYWNAVNYDIHSLSNGDNYRTREVVLTYEQYLDWLVKIFLEVYRCTKEGGFLSIIIGTILFEGKHYPIPHDLTTRLVSNGWEFHQDIIWHKTTAGIKRAGSFIQHPYPGYFYPNIMTEYILVFRKPGEAIYKGHIENKEDSRFPINEIFVNDIANNIWHIAPVPPRFIDHPCPFPEEIPYRLISLYSYKGDTVLDPFCGSGQTLKVARNLDRNYVGYDIIERYVELSKKRVNENLSIRDKQLIARFEKIDKE